MAHAMRDTANAVGDACDYSVELLDAVHIAVCEAGCAALGFLQHIFERGRIIQDVILVHNGEFFVVDYQGRAIMAETMKNLSPVLLTCPPTTCIFNKSRKHSRAG